MMSYDELLVQRISNREPFRVRGAAAYYNGTEYQIWSYGLKIASVKSERWLLRPIIFEQTQLRIQNIVREIGETVKDWEIICPECYKALTPDEIGYGHDCESDSNE